MIQNSMFFSCKRLFPPAGQGYIKRGAMSYSTAIFLLGSPAWNTRALSVIKISKLNTAVSKKKCLKLVEIKYCSSFRHHEVRNLALFNNEPEHDKTYNKTSATCEDCASEHSDQSSLSACAFYSLRAIQRGINKNPCHNVWIYRLI